MDDEVPDPFYDALMRGVDVFLLFERPEWHAEAACRGSDANFFPGQGENFRPAKNVCMACPVSEPCRAWAIERNEKHGIWGGLGASERADIRRARSAA